MKCVIPPPRNILCSFAYYSKFDLDRLRGCRIAADSGAVSVRNLGQKIETKNLVIWAKIYWHRLAWIASLDVSGDQPTSRRNWHEMVDAGVPGVPTIHLRDRPDAMDYYVERGVDFIGLGGTALTGTGQPDTLRWLVACFKYAAANHPQVRFHGWGMSKPACLRLPFFSVDSSSWSATYRYGRLALRDPLHRGKTIPITMNGRGTYTPEIAYLLRDCYGVNPSQVSTSGPHNRLLMVRLSALSASVQEQDVRFLHRHHPVTAPTWGRLGGWDLPQGPNQHLALAGHGAGKYDVQAIGELSGSIEPKGDGWQAPRGSFAEYGPHIHLVDDSSQHLEEVAKMQETQP